MKMMNQSVELMTNIPEPTDRMGVLKFLEKIGRTCYKSEDKITNESCVKFIEGLKKRKHWAMLEHYVFVFRVPGWIFNDMKSMDKLDSSQYDLIEKMNYIRMSYEEVDGEIEYFVSGSATAFNYLWETKYYRHSPASGLAHICTFLNSRYPELMMVPDKDIQWAYDPRIDFVGREEMSYMSDHVRLIHDSVSVKFIVDRGVSHELVRHRPASWAQESTRYCNYGSDKYNSEINVILPKFFDTGMGEQSNSLVFNEWKAASESSEYHYNKLIGYGATPQQARTVLNNSLKTEVWMTARMYEMKHFFNMRVDKPAHPQMKEVAAPLLQQCIEHHNDLFKDQAWRLEDNHEFLSV